MMEITKDMADRMKERIIHHCHLGNGQYNFTDLVCALRDVFEPPTEPEIPVSKKMEELGGWIANEWLNLTSDDIHGRKLASHIYRAMEKKQREEEESPTLKVWGYQHIRKTDPNNEAGHGEFTHRRSTDK